MNKRTLSERDICTKYITPAILRAGWNLETDIREEVTFTDGRVIGRGKHHTRGKQKRADYILNYQNIRLAIVEAKKNELSVGQGMQQAIQYAEVLQVPFVFTSNGDGFLFRDLTASKGPLERELSLEQFPTPEVLLRKYQEHLGLTEEGLALVTQDYHTDGSGKEPRYYQVNAVSRTLEAIARGQNRLLLVMATGTGKTYTAFQIIWRLWKGGVKKRILFLADRNILVDQTRTNDFKPFGQAMTKISNRTVDKSYEIFLSLYQAVTGTEEESNIYKQFSRDFFDLIVIDECHRGSASEASAWRRILEYFSAATHIGMTATPKETKDVSNISYFGEPVYTYSLKQGIDDGFLAPYKVIRIDLDRDTGWRPEKGQTDKNGQEIEDRIYNLADMDRTLVLEERTKLVAHTVSEFLRGTGRHDKTIVFCDNIDHAERMRQALVNENRDLVAQNSRYVMRITGDDDEGKRELDNFIDPESTYPVIATTSKLMSTGVDARTCKLIVLDQRIASMTEFKQIIGRGTRIYVDEENEVCPEKLSFTIMDFKRATELFADPDFDGPPEVVYEPGPGESPIPPDDLEGGDLADAEDGTGQPPDQRHVGVDHLPTGEAGEGQPTRRYVVAGVTVSVASERIQYYDVGGKLVTESLKDYTAKRVKKTYHSLDQFLQEWSEADKKAAIIRGLEEQGVVFQALAEEVGKDIGPFDLICHVVFGQPPRTRRERAENVRKKDYFTKYGEQARAVLSALLDKFSDGGLDDIESMAVLKVQPFSELGSVMEIVQEFGGKEGYQQAIRELESAIYSA
ncbi:EcoAI/FtnUII family type I restriction enzme subunit R [Nannocystaceae bacterium ST9]